jgi:hypothetical protein
VELLGRDTEAQLSQVNLRYSTQSAGLHLLNQSPIPFRAKVLRKKKGLKVSIVQTTLCNNTAKVGGEENTQSGS